MDTLVKVGDSLVQYGPENNRVYLIKLSTQDFPQIIGELGRIAADYGYTKIICKIPALYARVFLAAGYIIEAEVPGLFRGEQCGWFVAKYLDQARKQFDTDKLLELKTLIQKTPMEIQALLDSRFVFEQMSEADVVEMAQLYREVFRSYPFPIHQPEYLKETMRTNVEYFGIRHQNKLVALSSAEKDVKAENVEMTDFAVLNEYRGQRLSMFLLKKMEEKMKIQGISTAYTIARMNSIGMNLVFHKLGYHYGGTLANNTNICGGLESMNIWFKQLVRI